MHGRARTHGPVVQLGRTVFLGKGESGYGPYQESENQCFTFVPREGPGGLAVAPAVAPGPPAPSDVLSQPDGALRTLFQV